MQAMSQSIGEDDDYSHHVCYSPYGGLKNWSEAVLSANRESNPAVSLEILQKHHDSVKCTDAQRPIDNLAQANSGYASGAMYGYGYGIGAGPACVYEGLPDLEKIKISGFQSKKFAPTDLQKIRVPSTINAESAYEVVDEQGRKRSYAIVTYSAAVLKNASYLGGGYRGPAYAILVELRTNRNGTLYIPSNNWSYPDGKMCAFPYIPEGS